MQTDERLAYSIPEAAQKLGGVSARTVHRLIARGQLATCRVGRRVLVPAQALRDYVGRQYEIAHNPNCAEPVAWKGTKPCYFNAQGRRSGMSVTGTGAANELSVLLARLTNGKQGS